MSTDLDAATVIYTVGPAGTDAEFVARDLGGTVELCASFREAMSQGYADSQLALVACGYLKKVGGTITDTWVDLHYSYTGRMAVRSCMALPTKPICVARRRDVAHPRSIVLHPATEQFAHIYAPGLPIHYRDSKPLVVEAAARGEYDMCIGSVDVVRAYPGLTVVEIFQPQMVWSLYQRVDAPMRAHG